MKIGVLIITRGDRPDFVKHANYLLSIQTVLIDHVLIIDEKPLSNKCDITYRYKKGSKILFDLGMDCIVIIEDDDFYSANYIETMVKKWVENRKPLIFGLANTIYYSLTQKKYSVLKHRGRASMMSTLISREAVINWGEDNYPFADLTLWNQLKGIAIEDETGLCIGIKHGIGLCGGKAHKTNFPYSIDDKDFKYLESKVDKKSFEFYKSIHEKRKN